MTAKLDLALEFAGPIEAYPLEECGPSDDPDMITAYVMGWNRGTSPCGKAGRKPTQQASAAGVSGPVRQPSNV